MPTAITNKLTNDEAMVTRSDGDGDEHREGNGGKGGAKDDVYEVDIFPGPLEHPVNDEEFNGNTEEQEGAPECRGGMQQL